MFQRLIGPVLSAAGALILAVSLLANAIGQLALARSLGIGRDPGFGTEQAAGVFLGLAVLAVGIWLWRRPSAGKPLTVRYLVAFLAFAAVVGGPLYVMLKAVDTSLRPLAEVRPCVEVQPVPSSTGSTGYRRLVYGLQITNGGRVAVQVDSLWLRALRDTTASPIFDDEIVAISNRWWEQIDSLKLTASAPGRWDMRAGTQITRSRSLVLPPEALRPLYRFEGTVFFQHRDPEVPVVVFAGPDWVDSFTDECW
jgi:hypothetical protein